MDGMEATKKNILQKQRRGLIYPIPRAILSTPKLPKLASTLDIKTSAIAGFLGGTIISGLIRAAYTNNTPSALAGAAIDNGLTTAILSVIAFCMWPLLKESASAVWTRQRPSRDTLTQYTVTQKITSSVLLAWLLIQSVNYGYPRLTAILNRNPGLLTPMIANRWQQACLVLAVAIVLGWLFPYLLPKAVAPAAQIKQRHPKRRKLTHGKLPHPFGLWIGRSSGELSTYAHPTAMAANHEITLEAADAAQNILILGGIGSGKTTRLMQPLLLQLLTQDCGGLLFDVKGDVKPALITLNKTINHPMLHIGPGHCPLNLLHNLSPEMAATFLKSALLLGNTSLDRFWIDTATELCRHTLGLLSYTVNHYTLQGMYQYLFSPEITHTIDAYLDDIKPTLSQTETRQLNAYQHYLTHIFNAFDDKVKSSVKATLAQILSPFSHPALVDAFCDPTATQTLKTVLEGTIVLVELPLATWGVGAKVAYTLIKLQLFHLMQRRIHHPEWPQDRLVFFMCDEYQALISANPEGLSDVTFWDTSRSTKTLGIISSQSITSFYAAIGKRELADAILQNFRQKICFKTEDRETQNLLNHIAGNATQWRESQGQQENQNIGPDSSFSHSQSQSTQLSAHLAPVLTASLFRQLEPNQAIALLSLNGRSMDDIITCQPLYIGTG